jgi:hypothetical protein
VVVADVDATVTEYDTEHDYVRTATYDHGGRAVAMTLPTDPELLALPTIGGTLEYNERGLPNRVFLAFDGEAGMQIIRGIVYTRDGLVEQVTYGDTDDGPVPRDPTVSFTTYDDRRRPIRMRTTRIPTPTGMETDERPLSEVSVPHDQMLVWDLADNLIAVEDLRLPRRRRGVRVHGRRWHACLGRRRHRLARGGR